MKPKYSVGLALSGGGYRAAAFHVGTMSRLHELGILNRVDLLSTISGGSIVGAVFCKKEWVFQEFEEYMKEKLTTKSVIKYIFTSWVFIRAVLLVLIIFGISVYILFTSLAWLSPIIFCVFIYLLVCFQFAIFPVSNVIEKAYNDFFFDELNLNSLIDKPAIVIGSTDTQSARPFSFSKLKMGGSGYKSKFLHANFPVARAVMASSCVPFAFTPVHIDKEFYAYQDLNDPEPQLIDGGVYDNQGIHKLIQDKSSYLAQIVIVSDAGNKLPFQNAFNNSFTLMLRAMDVFMTRIKNFQITTGIYNNTRIANREIAYISLGWDISRCISGFVENLINGNITASVLIAHKLEKEWIDNPKLYQIQIIEHLEKNVSYEILKEQWPSATELDTARKVGTNLTKLSTEQVRCLIKQAYVLTGIQVKLYCPALLT